MPFLPNFATGYGLCYPGLINTYGSPGSSSVIDEELVQWWGGKIVNFQSMFTVKIKTNAVLPTVCFEMDFFLFASEELRSTLTCSRDKNAFSTDAERKHISELHSDYVVPLGNKAVIKFQNKM